MVTVFTSFYSIILIILLAYILWSKRNRPTLKKSESNGISVIIPFKNEAKRILPLIKSLNIAALPKHIEFIFIDDHSEDETVNILLAELDLPFTITKLKRTFGKKYAIKKGVSIAQFDSILTLDADISFSSNYFQNIIKLPESDLTILPVKMKGNRIFQKLNCIEFQWLQTLTFGLAHFNYPALCNGANLRFKKSAFNGADKIRNDAHLMSGDDIFLLKAIQNQKGNIQAVENIAVGITTEAPKHLKELLNQRLRWIKKMNSLNGILGVLFLVIFNLFFLYAVFKLMDTRTPYWSVPILLKLLIEWLGTQQYTLTSFVFIVLHQFYYPVYGLFIFFNLPFKRNW